MAASLGLAGAVAAPLIDKVDWDAGAVEMVEWLGHFHPLVLHFPIVLLLVALAFEAARLPGLRCVLPRPDAATVTTILGLGAVGCTLALVCGWLLAQGGGYEPDLLGRHLWAGSATAFGTNLALIMRLSSRTIGTGVLCGLANLTLTLTCGSLTLAGHYGASLTHGEGYLTEHAPGFLRQLVGLQSRHDPSADAIKPVEQRLLWCDVVQPILEERCIFCHHEGKAKGGLRLDSLTALLKGGASGLAVVPGNPQQGLLLKFLQLAVDDDKHMPPKGKPQPTEAQLAALAYWIEMGSPADKTAGDFELTASLRATFESLLTPVQRKTLEAKSQAEAASLETALATLRGKLPGRLACVVPGKPELAYASGIDFAAVSDAQLNALAPVAVSVVTLDLQQTKVTDAGLAALAPFTKLRKLQLQNTALSDAGLEHLGKLASLEILNLYGTGVTDGGLQHLAGLRNLKKIYLWQSKVTPEGVGKLRAAIPGVEVNLGLPEAPKPAAASGKDAPTTPTESNKP
jgi:hypothetical protein